VTLWGTGAALREFLHVDDLAEACLLAMENPQQQELGDFMNVGMGKDISIAGLAQLIGEVVGYQGEIGFDPVKPDGTPRKLLDVSRIHKLGWSPRIALREGITRTYQWYLQISGKDL
jgi:GDP-L-fucose synthase